MTVLCLVSVLVATAAAVMITAASVITAGVTFAVMIVVIAADIGVEAQRACKQVFHRGVSVTTATAVQGDTCLLECHLGTTTDTAADQHIRLEPGQNTCKGTVTAAVGVNNFGRNDAAVFHFIDLKLLGMTEMLEDRTISISNCDSHNSTTPLVCDNSIIFRFPRLSNPLHFFFTQ